MESTLLLAQVFGFYAVIGGIVVLSRRSYFMPVVGAFVEDKFMRLLIGALELVGGLFLVALHNDWTSFTAGVITLFGWAMLVEGIFYLAAPDSTVRSIVKAFNTTWWYVVGGLASIVLGLYLLNVVFGWVG